MSADSGPGAREVARRLFAAEFDDASLSYSESDEERAPNYVVTPTGARVNRLFAVGVLTEVESVNEDSLRGRVVDPTGAFVTYAGQYQPDENAFLSRASPPTFVALAGKARTFEPEDSDRVFTSVRPESLNEVDADTRDRWVVSAAERTLHRVAVFAAALDSELRGETLEAALAEAGVDASLAAGVPKAIEHYGTGRAYLEAVRNLAVEATEQVAGERDTVGSLPVDPDDDAPAELGPLPDVDVDLSGTAPAVEPEPEVETEAVEEPESAAEAEPEPEPETESVEEPESAAEPEAEPEPAAEAEPEPSTPPAAEPEEATADESEPEPEPEPSDDLGDFEPSGSVNAEDEGEGDESAAEPADAETDDALSEDERREVEEQFGTEFSTGSEVGAPGEAGIDVPTSEEELEELESEMAGEGVEDGESEAASATESEPEAEPEPEPGEDTPEPATDVDIEDAAIETMQELDDGDGADHDAVVDAVVEEHGVDADAVEEAIQDAMMSGRCYEPTDGTLKAI